MVQINYNNDLTPKIITLTGQNGINHIEGNCVQYGKVVCCHIGFNPTSGSITVSHNVTYVSGFPANASNTYNRFVGIPWSNGNSTQPATIRFTLWGGNLASFYPGNNVYISGSNPCTIQFAYICA